MPMRLESVKTMRNHLIDDLKLVKRQDKNTIIKVKDIEIGNGKDLVIFAGPCSVESESQMDVICNGVKEAGAKILRGGAYKLRTSPYSFQGLREEGLDILKKVSNKYNIPVVSEIVSIDDIKLFEDKVDIIQVGARNMENYELLKELGKTTKPILLKRGPAATIEEWLLSAEYILSNGNPNVILCERGIKTFENMTRNTLDLSSIPIIKQLTHLPVIVDPSHATGDWRLVESMSLAAIASGADGIILEVHKSRDESISDAFQALTIPEFEELVKKARCVAKAIGKDIE